MSNSWAHPPIDSYRGGQAVHPSEAIWPRNNPVRARLRGLFLYFITRSGPPEKLVTRRVILGLLVFVSISSCLTTQTHAGTDGSGCARGGSIPITDHGAVPDNKTDSTAAIKAAITVARLCGVSVLVPRGTFNHRSFILDGVSLLGAGPASVLVAPNPLDSNIYVRKSEVSVRNLTVKVNSSRRDAENFAIFIDHADGFTISDVTVDGGNAGGIFNNGGSNGRIILNRVENTLADAIHNTAGANNVLIAGNVVRHAGDDMIAVVSYKRHPISHDILIEYNDLAEQAFGRGISVVGGQNVTIQRNKVAQTNCCAGIYIASESASDTNSVHNVFVRDNILTANSGRTGHGAIMIFADQGQVSNISVERNIIINAKHAAITLLGAVGDINLVGNSFFNPAQGGITGLGSNVHCIDNLQDGRRASSKTCANGDDIKNNARP